MTKQVNIQGQRVQLYSPDNGRTWSSSAQSITAYLQRQTMLRLALQKTFQRIDEGVQDPDTNYIHAREIPRNVTRR